MKRAKAVAFPQEAHVPVANPDRWVLGLESKIPHLDPMHTIVRERGKPPRALRLEPELPVDERFGKRHGKVTP